ncbi:MAG: 16S rRNA (cytidine(1402)-2'-O)-methyltransferase [Deltaproteobacteria bacterium]|nr:16S rRNA (cytidine(1402)-2'-O)-methyltransferase [Deltaproteobacteria bacterium]
MAGLLSIVATPIGNLGDLSPRAAKALQEADIICAENIRHSKKLITTISRHPGVTRFLSCPAPKESACIPKVLNALEAEQHIVLISDAGMPAISDPGGKIIQAVIEAGHKLEVIPGPSAILAALAGSGLITPRFAFLGFLPKKGLERQRIILSSYQAGLALVIFESPHRISKTLNELHKLFGEQKIVVARELTKKFETFHRGILGGDLEPALIEKGEMVIIIEAGETRVIPDLIRDPAWTPDQVRGDGKTKTKARKLASQLGISVRDAYQKIISSK